MKYSELKRKLERDGWYILRQAKGSHVIYIHDTKKGKITVPLHGSSEIGKGLEKKILKAAGLK